MQTVVQGKKFPDTPTVGDIFVYPIFMNVW